MTIRLLLCLTLIAAVASAEPPRPAPVGAQADYHVHLKGGLTIEEAMRRSKADGITYGVAINGGLGQPAGGDADAEAFLAAMRPTLEKFDYIFTDAMTWSDDSGRRMRLWMAHEVGTIAEPERFMDMLVDRTTTIFAGEPADLYVNPTFLPDQIRADYDKLWTPARIERIVDVLVQNGVGMEINNRYRIPSRAVIMAAKEAGVKFSCGTNNAGADDLGRNEYCAEMIAACGLKTEHFWSPPSADTKAIRRRPLRR
jgi:hypothetical protein